MYEIIFGGRENYLFYKFGIFSERIIPVVCKINFFVTFQITGGRTGGTTGNNQVQTIPHQHPANLLSPIQEFSIHYHQYMPYWSIDVKSFGVTLVVIFYLLLYLIIILTEGFKLY